MVANDIIRWGLHELEGSGYVANDAGSSDVKPVLHEVPEVKARNNHIDSNTTSANIIGNNTTSGYDEVIEQPPIVETKVVDTRRKNNDFIKPVNEAAQPRVEIQFVEIRSSDIVPVNDFGEPLYERARGPFQHSVPSLTASTANDAVIAQTLHEEFQKLAAAEAAGQPVQEKELVLVQKWGEKPGTSRDSSSSPDLQGSASDTNYGHMTVYDWESTNEDMDQRKVGSLSTVSTTSSSQDPYSLDEDDRQLAIALSEQYQHVDKEVANRLTKLESMKHVPRTNLSFPTYEVASADHQRLAERLYLNGLTEQKIEGDGNCQFRALSDQLYRTPEHHKFVRKVVVKQLKTYPEVYANYVPMKYPEYLKNMAKNGEWGDHVTLQAASDHFGVRISLITSLRETCFIEIVPAEQKSNREIYLSFWAEVHYNSIYPIGDICSQQQQQHKKRHWHFF